MFKLLLREFHFPALAREKANGVLDTISFRDLKSPTFCYRIQSQKVFKALFSHEGMAKVRIKLSSIDVGQLNPVIQSIKDITEKSGVIMRGPIPLPTRRLKVTTRKSPCGNGTATFDRFEMRVHRRIIDIPADDKVLHPIMKLQIPRSVQIRIEMKD